MSARELTFVVDLPEPRSAPGSRGRSATRSGERAAPRSARDRKARMLRIAGRRIRSQRDLKSVFLEERGARRPSLFVSWSARSLAPLVEVAHDERGNLRLLLFEQISADRREYLQTLFRTVISLESDVMFLDSDELAEVLSAENRGGLFVGGTVNPTDEVLVLYRGSFDRLSVPFAWFARASDVEPDFSDFAVIDHGQTIRLGAFEAGADAILYDFDPEYRSQAKKRQLKLDESWGGALRRLRELKGVPRSAFPDVSAREIARIERSEVASPRRSTVEAIAKRLGVPPEEIAGY